MAGGLDLPTLGRLGLGSIAPLAGVPPATAPVLHGRLHPLGPGKDSTSGHWELMGVVQRSPLPTYPTGFPPSVVEQRTDLRRARRCRGKALWIEIQVEADDRRPGPLLDQAPSGIDDAHAWLLPAGADAANAVR